MNCSVRRLDPEPSSRCGRRPHVVGVLVVFCLLVALGCERKDAPGSYAARVGDTYLTEAELQEMMGTRVGLDTSEARQQIIEQWVNRTLLYQEALNRDLENEPDVQERLEEQRRTVLVTALTNQLHESFEVSPSQSDVRAYFERHRDQLQLREPYVRVRFLTTSSRDSATVVRRRILEAPAEEADSVWTTLARRYASAPERAQQLSTRFFAASRLLEELPAGQDVLARLEPREAAPVLTTDSVYHVLQLVERRAEGTDPKLEWVEPEIRRRLTVRARKQMYAREVQRLRNQAKARNALEIR